MGPREMTFQDSAVEVVATVFDAAYGLWVSQVLTLVWLAWVLVSFVGKGPGHEGGGPTEDARGK